MKNTEIPFPPGSPELKKAILQALACVSALDNDGAAEWLVKAARIIKEEDAKVFYPAAAEIKEGDLISISEGKAWPAGRIAETPHETQDHIGWPFAVMAIGFFFAMAWIITHIR